MKRLRDHRIILARTPFGFCDKGDSDLEYRRGNIAGTGLFCPNGPQLKNSHRSSLNRDTAKLNSAVSGGSPLLRREIKLSNFGHSLGTVWAQSRATANAD